MNKPWGDKYDFLASLSKERKYQDLLQEIDQSFVSDVSLCASSPRHSVKLVFWQCVIYVKPISNHPAWARWTWTQAWLPESFHSGRDKQVWRWLQSCPYTLDLSLEEGVRGDFSVDGIALGIGSLLRDMEAMQFSDEFHPPQLVAHSKVSFTVVATLIIPALDNFLKVVRDHNNVSDKTLSLVPLNLAVIF
jgi:hypothetical protein